MDKASITRFVGLIVGLLTYFGINIPNNISEAVVGIIVGVIAIYTAWRNNNFTNNAQKAQKYLNELKRQEKGGK